jgi:hypothetical protein
MWRILAYCREDGWAVIGHADKVSLLRPPFARGQLTPLDPAALPRLLAQPGMLCPAREQQDHTSLPVLIDFLNQEILRSRADSGHALPESGYGPRLLAMAPAPVLARMLDRIESELLGQGRLEQARTALVAVLGAPACRESQEILGRTAALLQRVDEAVKTREKIRADAADIPKVYPAAARRYGVESLRDFNAASRTRNPFGLPRAA